MSRRTATTTIRLAAVILGTHPAGAADCRDHIMAAESAYAAPPGLILAVGSVESGFEPWSVNADGRTFHPASIDDAERLVRRLQQGGARHIDVGCMQIDLHHHPRAFASLREAFDPRVNVAYGARVLADNRRRYGSWAAAVAYYHSGDPDQQASYLSRISARYAEFGQSSRLSLSGPSLQARPAAPTMVRLSLMTVRRPPATDASPGWR